MFAKKAGGKRMANQEHLEILKQGVKMWNQWRIEHADVKVDLSRANLSFADLSFANLSNANLSRANLSRADLSVADLNHADLSHADFYGAVLYGTDFTNANLSYANKINTGLIIGTIFTKATLLNADFTNARFEEADFTDADLTGAKLSFALLSNSIYTRTNFTEAKLNSCKANVERTEFIGATFIRADLRHAKLKLADFTGGDLTNARFEEADLTDANFTNANLSYADFHRTNLRGANLTRANLTNTILSNANLINANLSNATLVGTNLTKGILNNCVIYGISAWDVQLEGAKQLNLIITPKDEPIITVDNLKIAQFIYLLLNNKEIREVIDTIAKKAVLILGRFTPERKVVLDVLREALRTHGYLPILFDFEKPSSRDLTETVSTLAHLARFIVADLTEPSSLPKELEAIVPTLAVPVQPLLEGSTRPYAMFQDYWKYQWVLEVYCYNGIEELLASLKEYVIEPAERKAKELAKLRAQEFEKQ